jgi:hypothetical protein
MTRTPTTKIPTRHPRDRADVPLLGPLAKLLGINPPTDAEWQVIGEALTVGDAPMDELVDWMYETGMEKSRPLFNRALTEGIDSIEDPPEPLHEFFTRLETPPSWLDWNRIRVGERMFQRAGIDGVYIARDVPFLGGFVASGINRTLMLTKTGKSGATGGGQRFAETLQWGLDVTSTGGLRHGGPGYRSTVHVRLIHGFVRRHVGRLSEWRAADWGVPVNQTDMAATMLGALFAPAVGAVMMGMIATPRELDGIVHLVRYTGWLMGIEERYLPGGFRDATKQLYHYLMALNSPDETSRKLAQPMADDPLRWHYRNFAPIRRRIAWAQHLSITTTFMGRRRTQQLGLPGYMPPWYPAMRLPINMVSTGIASMVPGGRDRQARSGCARQHAFLETLIGPKAAASIGESANYIHAA